MLSTVGPTSTSSGPVIRHAGLALVALAATDFLSVLDGLLVAVALPQIQSALGFTQTGLGWVVTAYVLVFAGGLLIGGRIADLYGRRRVLIVGYALFALGGLLGGLATDPAAMIAGRAVQGLGAAAMTPAGLSLLTVVFPEPAARNRALGVWAAAGSVGIPAGALLGGLISSSLGWRWVLLVNVPAAVVAAGLAIATLPTSRARNAGRLDLPGAVTGTLGLASIVFAVTQLEPLLGHQPTLLPGPWSAIIPLVTGILLLVSFVAIERRSPNPLLSWQFLRTPGVARANLAAAGLPIGLGAMMFVATQYVQEILGLSPWQTGLTYLALALPVVMASPLAANLVSRLGRKRTAALGFALQASGLLWLLLTIDPAADLATTVLPSFVLTGLGAPIAYIPVTGAAVDDVGDDSGLASGLFNTTQQVANALALAAMSTAVALAGTHSDPASPALTPAGVRAGLGVGVVLALLALAAATRLRDSAHTHI